MIGAMKTQSIRVLKKKRNQTRSAVEGTLRLRRVNDVAPKKTKDEDVGDIHESTPLPCTKISYGTEEQATDALRTRPAMKSYKCFCGSWHLTKNRRQ